MNQKNSKCLYHINMQDNGSSKREMEIVLYGIYALLTILVILLVKLLLFYLGIYYSPQTKVNLEEYCSTNVVVEQICELALIEKKHPANSNCIFPIRDEN